MLKGVVQWESACLEYMILWAPSLYSKYRQTNNKIGGIEIKIFSYHLICFYYIYAIIYIYL